MISEGSHCVADPWGGVGHRDDTVTAFAERIEGGRARRRESDQGLPSALDAVLRGEVPARWHHPSPTSSSGRRRALAAGSQVVACLDVRPASEIAFRGEQPELLWRLAVRRMERCIRPEDQLCMLGGARFAVCLGSVTNGINPGALGRRLARAVGDHLTVGPTGLDLHVAIGIGAGTSAVEPAELTAAALTSLQVARRRVTRPAHTASAQLAVAHVPERRMLHTPEAPAAPAEVDAASAAQCQRRKGRTGSRIIRRVVLSLDDGHSLVAGPLSVDGPALATPTDGSVSAPGSGLRLLLVDPDPGPDNTPRPVVEALSGLARRLGAWPLLSPAMDADSLLLSLYLTQPDAVLFVLQAESPRTGTAQDAAASWDRPARLVRAVRDVGTPVIAVSVGASAAALAVCVEQGAVGLLHSDHLAHELTRLAVRHHGTNGGGTNGQEDAVRPGQLPHPYDALVHLTPSERRVLFQMMEGWSAAEIAATLVVSLTTVRSHIRSILRKLNVKSQLAAVALAFGTLPDQASPV